MDRASAVALIRQTFESQFDKERYTQLVWNLLKTPEKTDSKPLAGPYIPAAFRGHIKSYSRIGKYHSPQKERIDLLVINLHRDSSLAHARTMQRNFIRWYLKYGRNGADKDAVLAAVVSPEEEDWRFSLVRMDYSLEPVAAGGHEAKERLTPAKRFSFLVGKNETSHTAQQALLPLLLDDSAPPSLADLEQAFNVEKITKEFYGKYKELFCTVKEALDKIVAEEPAISAEFDAKRVSTADFAKKLLGQIVFLYFLQKKGWFGVARDAEWGTGPKDYIRSLFEKKSVEYHNFFNDVLEPLFYNTLAWPRSGDFADKFNCKIPFLNGGLFDPPNDYDWLHTDILLPNGLFSNTVPTKEGDTGTGILDVFDRYNFTVCEDEPLEKEVAVDPEMLGKVFENLLEVTDRKSKGAYYTPREIVHYMCQESLTNYLAAELPEVDRGDIELLIRSGDTSIENDAAAAQCEEDGTSTWEYKLPPTIRANAPAIDDKLDSIRVCDPAVGSGAFVVGMMNEIVRARLALARPADKQHTPYRLKWHAIQNCLYGVDIDPGAVEIAKLRLWLSLVVDEEDRASIQPLPNLDYKIMQGNSLLDEYKGVKLFDESILGKDARSQQHPDDEIRERLLAIEHQILNLKYAATPNLVRLDGLKKERKRLENALQTPKAQLEQEYQVGFWDEKSAAREAAERLRELHLRFFNQTNADNKKEIKAQIEALEWELIEASLKEQGKDSALAEVAQFRQDRTKPFFLWRLSFSEVFEEKDGFDVVIANPPYAVRFRDEDKQYLSAVYPSVSDYESSEYFLLRTKAFLRTGGILIFIIPNTFMVNYHAKKYRRFLLDNWRFIRILNLSHFDVFASASVRNCIVEFQNSDFGVNDTFCLSNFVGNANSSGEVIQLSRTQLKFSMSNWLTLATQDGSSAGVVAKIRLGTKPLSDYAEVSQGLIPYDKYRGHSAETIKNRIWHAASQKDGTYRRELQGKDVSRYQLKWNEKNWISYGEWLAAPRRQEFFTAKRILVREITNPRVLAAYTEDEYYNTPSIINVIGVKLDPLYLLAIINSKLMSFYHVNTSPKAKKGIFPKILVDDVRQLPIKPASRTEQEPLANLARAAMSIYCKTHWSEASDAAADIERQIDQHVYELYGLTAEDIAIVEEASCRSTESNDSAVTTIRKPRREGKGTP
jgi:type I restriction-modification system DNA methylase subunit